MGENFIFYTKEETVKFINRFIKKKKSYNQYTQILESSDLVNLTSVYFSSVI